MSPPPPPPPLSVPPSGHGGHDAEQGAGARASLGARRGGPARRARALAGSQRRGSPASARGHCGALSAAASSGLAPVWQRAGMVAPLQPPSSPSTWELGWEVSSPADPRVWKRRRQATTGEQSPGGGLASRGYIRAV